MIRVDFAGGKELADALTGLSQRMTNKLLREALMAAGEPLRARWARLAPRSDQPPHAGDTLTMSTSRGIDRREAAIAVGPSKEGFYLSFQEFGTDDHGAQPSGRPAFDMEKQTVLAKLGAALWTELAARGISRSGSPSGPVVGGPGGGTL